MGSDIRIDISTSQINSRESSCIMPILLEPNTFLMIISLNLRCVLKAVRASKPKQVKAVMPAIENTALRLKEKVNALPVISLNCGNSKTAMTIAIVRERRVIFYGSPKYSIIKDFHEVDEDSKDRQIVRAFKIDFSDLFT